MMKMRLFTAVLAASVLGGSALQAATVVGTQAISDNGRTTATATSGKGTPFGDVSTSSIFTFPGLTPTGGQSIDFAQYANTGVAFPTAQLNLAPTGPFSFTFGDTTFGTFTATSFIDEGTASNTRTIYLLGTFTPGSDFTGGPTTPGPASFLLTLNQNGGANSAIQAGGTLASPPVAAPTVPEPASVAMLAAGLGLMGLTQLRRKAAR